MRAHVGQAGVTVGEGVLAVVVGGVGGDGVVVGVVAVVVVGVVVVPLVVVPVVVVAVVVVAVVEGVVVQFNGRVPEAVPGPDGFTPSPQFANSWTRTRTLRLVPTAKLPENE